MSQFICRACQIVLEASEVIWKYGFVAKCLRCGRTVKLRHAEDART